ncbi:hypothetical protein KS4_02580 [Poriferisphaera corsica]|uniref:Uncharacterized protein n=1 Tax=Poriferisphaera corsica TaxID=2528020 RepID=A0A517YPU8_9BACT|nr:hypothetical protein [Poriferisphaera corsica]QDU32228.1 hypothetical protein KS4_02580 [Poriferisphaera corsica]
MMNLIEFVGEQMDGEWVWVLAFYLPTVLVSLMLLGMWYWGRSRGVGVRCNRCGEALDGLVPEELVRGDGCPGCRAAVSEKKGVRYVRVNGRRRGLLLVMAGCLLVLPILSGGVLMYVDYAYRGYYDVRSWDDYDLIGVLLKPQGNVMGKLAWQVIDDRDVWEELVERIEGGAFDEKERAFFEQTFMRYLKLPMGGVNGRLDWDSNSKILQVMLNEEVVSREQFGEVIDLFYRKPKLIDGKVVLSGDEGEGVAVMGWNEPGWKESVRGMPVYWFVRHVELDGEAVERNWKEALSLYQDLRVEVGEVDQGEHVLRFELVGKFVEPDGDLGVRKPYEEDLVGAYYEMVAAMEVKVVRE